MIKAEIGNVQQEARECQRYLANQQKLVCGKKSFPCRFQRVWLLTPWSSLQNWKTIQVCILRHQFILLHYGSPRKLRWRVKYIVGYIMSLFLVTWMSILPFHGSDSCIWVDTSLYFENFLCFGKLWPKYQVSILTMSLDIYFQIFLVNSIFYLFLKGAATVKNIPSSVPMNHLMPLESRPKEMAYQIHFRFKQLGNSFWKEWLGGVFCDNENLSYIMKNDIFITIHTH